MVDVDLNVTGGLPYARRIRIRDGTKVWPSVDDFEVRSEVRSSNKYSSRLKFTLSPYITSSIDGSDIVLDLRMTGSETRQLYGGFYDMIVSDKGGADVRAIRILKGRLLVEHLVTGE